ncbi:MAG: hypothetical protein WCQ99_16465 [Pseudomonadota bacterium]
MSIRLKNQGFKIAIFFVGFFILDWIFSLFLSWAFNHTERGETTGGNINKVINARPQVVVIGNSRAQRNFNPLMIQKVLSKTVYVVGASGQGIPYIRGAVDILLHQYKPDLFIINIDPAFIDVVNHKKQLDRVAVLSSFFDSSQVIREIIYNRGMLERIKYVSRTFRYNGKILAILSNLFKKDESNSGYVPLQGTLGVEDIYKKKDADTKLSGVADAYIVCLLTETIRQVAAHGSRIVFITSPTWGLDATNDSEYKKLLNNTKSISQEYQIPYLYIDASNTPAFRDPSLFRDADHLNISGAEIFSALVADWLAKNGYARAN